MGTYTATSLARCIDVGILRRILDLACYTVELTSHAGDHAFAGPSFRDTILFNTT